MMDEEYIKLTQEWHRKGFESRQAEIDELLKRESKSNDINQFEVNHIEHANQQLRLTVDELQKRIDKIEGLVFGLDGDNDQYNLILCVNGVKKILKGATP